MTPDKFDNLSEQHCQRIQAVGDQLAAVLAQHEREEHEGEFCPTERLNALVYMAMVLNLSPEAVAHVARTLDTIRAEYAREEEET